MIVENNRVVSIDYTLKDDNGTVLDTSTDAQPLDYLHGNGNLIEGLEEALAGKTKGDKFSVSVPPEKAYGSFDPERLLNVGKEHLSMIPDLQEGMPLQMDSENGLMIVTVKEIKEDEVVIDANHPFVDKTLHFEVAVVDVREASEEEIKHGHPHQAGHDCCCGGHDDDHECCGGHGHDDDHDCCGGGHGHDGGCCCE